MLCIFENIDYIASLQTLSNPLFYLNPVAYPEILGGGGVRKCDTFFFFEFD